MPMTEDEWIARELAKMPPRSEEFKARERRRWGFKPASPRGKDHVMTDRDELIKLAETWDAKAVEIRENAHAWAVTAVDMTSTNGALRKLLLGLSENGFIGMAEVREQCASDLRATLASQ